MFLVFQISLCFSQWFKKLKLVYLSILLLCSAFLNAQIAFYGDTRTHPETHRLVVTEIAKHHPQMVFHTGDLNSKGTKQSEYDTFKEIISPLSKSASFYPARGNHEKDLTLFLQNFPKLEGSSYYTVQNEGIRFIILDSVQDLKPGSVQYRWLSKVLETKLPSILILHHPVFSSGEHGDELGLQLYLPRLLEGKDVLAVLSGHDHNYERSSYKGITYLVTGGGGAPLRESDNNNPYSLKFIKTNHFLIAQRVGDTLQFSVYGLEGDILDSFTIAGFREP